MRILTVVAFALAYIAPAVASGCAVGVYQGPESERIVVTNHAEANAPADYRYTMLDGRRGSVTTTFSPIRCDEHGFLKRTADGWGRPWRVAEIKETPTHFRSLGTDLYGILVEPTDAPLNRPLVIFVHGSEKNSDIGTSYQYILLPRASRYSCTTSAAPGCPMGSIHRI